MEYDRHSLSGYSISHFLEETENCINALFDPIEKPKKAEAQFKKNKYLQIFTYQVSIYLTKTYCKNCIIIKYYYHLK